MSLHEPFGFVVVFTFLPFLRLSYRSQFAWPSLRLSCLDSSLRLEKGMEEKKIGESALQEPVTALNGQDLDDIHHVLAPRAAREGGWEGLEEDLLLRRVADPMADDADRDDIKRREGRMDGGRAGGRKAGQ
jgi:hypothetical protein